MPDRRDHLFVVRMWREHGAGADAAWRGSVHHVGTERRFLASAPLEIAYFIEARLNDDAPSDEEEPPRTSDPPRP